MTAFSPVLQLRSISAAIALSHGQRSSSVSGWPALILAMLLAGGDLSPSTLRQPMRSANLSAMVLLPDPETPIMISAHGVLPASATNILRQRRLVQQPDGFALRPRAICREILAGKHACQDL